jgi:phage terminase large subunit
MSLVVERVAGRPPEGATVYRPMGACKEMFYARDPEVLLEGPAGTGKSRAVLEKLHILAQKYDGMRGAIVRKTRESLTQSAIVTYENKVLPTPVSVPFSHEDQEYRYANGSKLVVGGMDKASRIMSSEYDVIYVQEATEIAEGDAEYLLTRLRNGVMPYQQFIADCNPDAPEHWLNKRCVSGRMRRLRSTHADNPSVTPEYMAILGRLTGYRRRRLLLGEWVAAEGQFFGEWDPDIHMCEAFAIPKDWTRWIAIDYGFADPFCALWFARNPADKHRIYIYRESYSTGLRDEQQAALIKKNSEGERISRLVGDPSMFNNRTEQNKPSIATVYATGGVSLQPGVNSRIPGWQTVRRALALKDDKPPRLQIMEGRAPNLVRTLPSMVHDPLDSEDLADKIKSQKTEDHAVDALRYGLMLESMPGTQQTTLHDFGFEAG